MKIEEKDSKLVITDFSEIEAYKIAYKIEKDGLSFYKEIISKIDDPKIKEAFDFLIGQEGDHLKFFQDSLFELRKRQEDENEDDDLLEAMDFGIFQPYKSMQELEKILTQPKEALKLGVVIEEKSIKFYQSCREKVSSPSAKEHLGSIIEEEKKHKSLIESMLY